MTVQQVKDFIYKQGWTPQEKPRRKGKLYLYAARRFGKEIKWCYFGALSKVDMLTEDSILAKLEKRAK